jgi:hypothetical protein
MATTLSTTAQGHAGGDHHGRHVKSGLLNNDTGLIQSGGAMTIDTNGRR